MIPSEYTSEKVLNTFQYCEKVPTLVLYSPNNPCSGPVSGMSAKAARNKTGLKIQCFFAPDRTFLLEGAEIAGFACVFGSSSVCQK